MLVSAVSCALNAVNWFSTGVSHRLQVRTIALTVVAHRTLAAGRGAKGNYRRFP